MERRAMANGVMANGAMARGGIARGGTARAGLGNRSSWVRTRAADRPHARPDAFRGAIASAGGIDPAFPRRSRLDWSGVRAGLLEVSLTLAATIGLGFAWAAVESARLGAPAGGSASRGEERAITAAGFETGYPALLPTGR